MVTVRPMAKPAILLKAPCGSTAVAKKTNTRMNVSDRFENHGVHPREVRDGRKVGCAEGHRRARRIRE